MSNALVKMDFDKEQMAVIESQFFPSGASKAEQQYCFSVARELCLNPITKEIFFVKRRQKIGETWINKVEPMVGRDGFLAIAHRTNQFAGIETNVSIRDVPQLENSQWVFRKQLVAECMVWRKDSSKPFTAQVAYNEYCQKTNEGTPTKFWAEKPETMLKKVAESQALRKAFNICGVYSPEEMGAGFELSNGEIVSQSIEADYTRLDTEKSQQKSRPEQTRTTRTHAQQPVLTLDEEESPVIEGDDIPDFSSKRNQVIDDIALQVIDLLDSKHIAYDVILDGNDGMLSANSFTEKELLKSSGFRWSPDTKRWVFKFRNEPF